MYTEIHVDRLENRTYEPISAYGIDPEERWIRGCLGDATSTAALSRVAAGANVAIGTGTAIN
jgi:hypothetical protein